MSVTWEMLARVYDKARDPDYRAEVAKRNFELRWSNVGARCPYYQIIPDSELALYKSTFAPSTTFEPVPSMDGYLRMTVIDPPKW